MVNRHGLKTAGQWVLCLLLMWGWVLGGTAKAQEQLLFCNTPERLRVGGVCANTTLQAGQTYTLFYHYRNQGEAGPFVVRLHGIGGKPLQANVRKGLADAQLNPCEAGRQAMARFLTQREITYWSDRNIIAFTYPAMTRQILSGMLTIRCNQPTRLLVYFRHERSTIPGAKIMVVQFPRRQVQIALSPDVRRQSFRLGARDGRNCLAFAGGYGMVYTMQIAAPPGRRVRVSFSPRGGRSGMVCSINGTLHQSKIVETNCWRVLSETTIGKQKMILTTSPFGGVSYPVEMVFQLI